MSEDEKDDGKDRRLTAWLRLWEAPPAPVGLGERLKASYRSGVQRPPLWTRLLEARIHLPLPLAALVVVLVLGIGVLAGRQLSRGPADRGERWPVAGEGGLANLRPLPEVRVTVLKQGGESNDRP